VRPEKNNQPKRDYFPNIIGNFSPGLKNHFAFLIGGRHEGAVLSQVLHAFRIHGVTINSFRAFNDKENREFAICITSDFSNGNLSPENIAIELRMMKFIRDVYVVPLKNRIFDGFLFPLTIMYSDRVVAMDSGLLFKMQERFSSEEGNRILEELGSDYILEIFQRLNGKLGKKMAVVEVQKNVLGYLKAAGWGAFKCVPENDGFKIVIRDPPTSMSGDASNNHFLRGVLAGLVESFYGSDLRVVEEAYDPVSRTLTTLLSQDLENRRSEVKVHQEESFNSTLKPQSELEKSAALEVDRIAAMLLGKGESGKDLDQVENSANSDRREVLSLGRGENSQDDRSLPPTVLNENPPIKQAEKKKKERKDSDMWFEQTVSG